MDVSRQKPNRILEKKKNILQLKDLPEISEKLLYRLTRKEKYKILNNFTFSGPLSDIVK